MIFIDEIESQPVDEQARADALRDRRYRMVPVSFDLLHDMVVTGWTTGGDVLTCTEGIPPSVVFVAAFSEQNEARMIFCDPSFDPVPNETWPPAQIVKFSREHRADVSVGG